MKITVSVEQQDIDEGCRFDLRGANGGCMVYRAFMRATEGAFPYVAVWGQGVDVYADEESLRTGVLQFFTAYDEPWAVRDRIDAFDRGEPVSPFEFTVEIPNEVLNA